MGERKGNIAATLHAHTPLNAFTNGCATGHKMAKNLIELFSDQVWVSNDWDCVVLMVPVEFKLEVEVSLKNVEVKDNAVEEAFALDSDDIIAILALTVGVVV